MKLIEALLSAAINVAVLLLLLYVERRRQRVIYTLGLKRGVLEGRIAARRELSCLLPEEVVCQWTMIEASARDVFDKIDRESPRWVRAANAEISRNA